MADLSSLHRGDPENKTTMLGHAGGRRNGRAAAQVMQRGSGQKGPGGMQIPCQIWIRRVEKGSEP